VTRKASILRGLQWRAAIMGTMLGSWLVIAATLYLLAGRPPLPDNLFLGWALPLSLGGAVVLSILINQWMRRHHG
jgi:hypothetical protein